jgi:Zn-dependent protease with chaperone function
MQLQKVEYLNSMQMTSYTFDFKVYLAPTVNAFALGDGTIRVYSGLMVANIFQFIQHLMGKAF